MEEIERKHRTVISQYELMLKTINTEFKVLLARNQELESQLATQQNELNHSRDIPTDILRQEMIQEKLSLQQRENELHTVTTQLRREKEDLSNQVSHLTQLLEEHKREQSHLKLQ